VPGGNVLRATRVGVLHAALLPDSWPLSFPGVCAQECNTKRSTKHRCAGGCHEPSPCSVCSLPLSLIESFPVHPAKRKLLRLLRFICPLTTTWRIHEI
jgi:hypothetical protein